MRVHVVRQSDDLVVNTIVADEIPVADETYRYVECIGGERTASPGCWLATDGEITYPGPTSTDTTESLLAEFEALRARFNALEAA